jgi:carboxymethylenebutenolidase
MTPQEQEAVWDAHVIAEFATKDIDAVMATVTNDVENRNMPTGPGVKGRDAVRAFYRDQFIPSLPTICRLPP